MEVYIEHIIKTNLRSIHWENLYKPKPKNLEIGTLIGRTFWTAS